MTRRALLDGLLLALAVAVAAFLRFDHLGEPSYWLDEILHQTLTTSFAEHPWWRWIVAFHDEHGTLYYLTQLATRLFGTSEAAGRSAAALLGVATIPMVWVTSRSTRAAALLVAVSPMHVYFSREARGYALLMFLTAALIVVLLRARSLPALCLVLAGMLYTAAVAAPVVASALVVCLLCALQTRDRWFWRAALASGVTFVLFRVIYAAKPVEDPTWPGFPGLTPEFFASLARMFTVSALGTEGGGRVTIALLILAIVGAVALVRRSATHAIVVIGMTLLPLCAAIASLKVFDHFFAGRYVTPALVGFLLLAGAGLSFLLRYEALAAAAAVVIATQTWTAARNEPFQKLDWRAIAKTIGTHAKPGELVIAAEPWSEVSLRYYLDQLPQRVELLHLFAADVADIQRQTMRGTWLVTAGFTANPEVRHWMCHYPLVLASRLENFRLHYASPEIDRDARLFYGDGWGTAEGSLRWAVGTRASVTIPSWNARDETITIRVMPMAHDSLPAQTIRIVLNGHVLRQITLPRGWSEQSVVAPRELWATGPNALTFHFGHAVAPASLDPNATDQRPLAAAFEVIRAGGPLARVTSLIDEKVAWRNTETRFPAGRLARDRVRPLIARLGFDPDVVWPKLARGDVRLDDLVETAVWDASCKRNDDVLRTAFAVLLEREPAPHEMRELVPLDPVVAVGRIAKWDEFRDRVLLPKAAPSAAPGRR